MLIMSFSHLTFTDFTIYNKLLLPYFSELILQFYKNESVN